MSWITTAICPGARLAASRRTPVAGGVRVKAGIRHRSAGSVRPRRQEGTDRDYLHAHRAGHSHPLSWLVVLLSAAGGSLTAETEGDVAMPLWAYLLSAALVLGLLYYFFRVLRKATKYE